MYERKDRSDSESTLRPLGVEVKLRPSIHEIYLTFLNILVLKTAYNAVMYKCGKLTKWACNITFNGKCILKTK